MYNYYEIMCMAWNRFKLAANLGILLRILQV